MKVRVAQIGARKSYAVPGALAATGEIESLYTDIYGEGPLASVCARLLTLLGARRAAQNLQGRVCKGLDRTKVVSRPFSGLLMRRKSHAGVKGGTKYASYLYTGKDFARFAARGSFDGVDIVYAFSSAALELFEVARKHGVVCVLDHETAPALLEAAIVYEAERRFEAWLPYSPKAPCDEVRAYAERQSAEVENSDLVVCPSTFSSHLTARSGADVQKLVTLPFSPGRHLSSTEKVSTYRPGCRQLRLLFAGNDAIRKGLPVLVEALGTLCSEAVEVRAAGNWSLSSEGLSAAGRVLDPLGAVPRSEMRRLYEWADVFVLPTFSDTMGVVILEAMQFGVPVITTRNSGGPDLVRHGIDGFVVDAGDSDAIASSIEKFLTEDQLVLSCSRSAFDRAKEFDFETFGNKLYSVLQSHLVAKE